MLEGIRLAGDTRDFGPGRADTQPLAKLADQVRLATGKDLHSAIRQVLRVARQSQPLGLLAGSGAEKDPLPPARYQTAKTNTFVRYLLTHEIPISGTTE